MADIRSDGSVSLGTSVPGANAEPNSGRDASGGVMGAYDTNWWEENWGKMEGADSSRGYQHYEPALRYGWDAAGQHRGHSFDQAEPALRDAWTSRHADRGDYASHRGTIRHAFERAMHVFEGAKDPDARR